jgi:glucosamine kinase
MAASAGPDGTGDPVAAAILREAGRELARLARALAGRFGERPVALAGRAATLHPLILTAMRAALPPATTLTRSAGGAHHAAARMAAIHPQPITTHHNPNTP